MSRTSFSVVQRITVNLCVGLLYAVQTDVVNVELILPDSQDVVSSDLIHGEA